MPDARPVSYAFWKVAREAAAKGRVRMNTAKREREQALLKEERARQREDEMKKNRDDERLEDLARAAAADEIRRHHERVAEEELRFKEDQARSFLSNNVVRTGIASDFVDKVGLYDIYKLQHPREKSKKTALGKRKFGDQVMAHLGPEQYFEDNKRIPGTGIVKRKVWLGVTLLPSSQSCPLTWAMAPSYL